MGITRGFGTEFDLKSGMSRQWVMGSDGIKRWADTMEPIESKPVAPDGEQCQK